MPGCCQCEEFRRLADLSAMQELPVARGFIPAGLQSSPKTCHHSSRRRTACEELATAAQPSGDKSPRHKEAVHMPGCCQCEGFRRLADLSVMRGLPVARGFIPVGLQSSPKTCHHGFYRHTACEQVAPATQPSGDKSPRHKDAAHILMMCLRGHGFSWLADLSVMRGLPVARGFIPVGLQSSPKTCQHDFYRHTACEQVAPATQPSGDKSPRHNRCTYSRELLRSEPAGIPKRVITEVIDQPGSQGIIDDIAGDGLQVLAVTDRSVMVAGLPQRSVTSGFSVNRMRTASLYTANDFTK